MTKFLFKNPLFIKTATTPAGFPILRDSHGNLMPEIAVAGRSNVGKSSLLNHLFQVKGLVKTSSTPGKTQALNFFTLNQALAFVDLPGYGYAQVPPSVRKKWGPMIQTYLEKRPELKLILFLFDIRRLPTEEDIQLIDWAAHYQKAMILVLTKVDKVTQNEKAKKTQQILKTFGERNLHHLHYSVTKNVGRQILMAMIQEAIESELIHDDERNEDETN